MDAYVLILAPISAAVSATDNRGQTEEHAIKGKTTFQELLDWGLLQESIEQIIGEPISSLEHAQEGLRLSKLRRQGDMLYFCCGTLAGVQYNMSGL